MINTQNIAIAKDVLEQVNKWQKKANTVVYFADENKVLAVLAIADQLKSSSKAAIQRFQERGIEVYMLTGDNQETAKAVASEVGIKEYVAEVMPSDKADFVEKLQQQGKIVGMVGDGINDSHALAKADLRLIDWR